MYFSKQKGGISSMMEKVRRKSRNTSRSQQSLKTVYENITSPRMNADALFPPGVGCGGGRFHRLAMRAKLEPPDDR